MPAWPVADLRQRLNREAPSAAMLRDLTVGVALQKYRRRHREMKAHMSQDEIEKDQAQTSVTEFWEALRKGSGRATILLQKKPQDPELNTKLLRACVENLAYDPQCEAQRAPYLCELIWITGQQNAYRDALQSCLRTAVPDNSIDVGQVFGILARLAERDGVGADVLREFVLATGDRRLAEVVAPEFIRLQGLDALLASARRFSPEIADDPWLFAGLVYALEEREGVEAATAALQEARRGDAAFDRLMGLAEDRTGTPGEPVAVPAYATLKAEIGARRRFPRAWVTGASQEDIERAAEDLLTETDDGRVLAYLAIFDPRIFPGDPTRLFPFVASDNRRVAFFAAGVLARISHPAIRSFAHHLIAEGWQDLGARLLRSSHGEGDIALLKTLLDRFASDEDRYHSLGLSTLHVINNMAETPEEAQAVLLHLYENGPCSNCRRKAVDQLAAMDGIPVWMAREGRYDAEPGIAERFRGSVLAER